MADLGDALLVSGLAVLALMALAFAGSLPLRDVSIVDIAWGLAFVNIGWVAAAVAGGDAGRTALMLVLVSVWGLRLAIHISIRKARDPGEDPRYGKMRERHGDRFPLASAFTIFGFQALVSFVVALPLQGIAAGTDPSLGPLAFAGVALWLVGFVFEAGGDHQLARFKSDPANKGKVMHRGLWRHTRHPNYSGDFAVWWGFYLVALDAGAWWSFPGPLIMTLLLTRVSGRGSDSRATRSAAAGVRGRRRAPARRVPRRIDWT